MQRLGSYDYKHEPIGYYICVWRTVTTQRALKMLHKEMFKDLFYIQGDQLTIANNRMLKTISGEPVLVPPNVLDRTCYL